MLANRGLRSALVVGGLVSIGACEDCAPREPADEQRRSALTSGTFVERARLIVSTGGINGELSQIATSGDGETVAITGPGTNRGPSVPLGAVYVFVRPPGGWSGALNEQARLVPSDGATGDQFARVAMDGDVIVVGSYEDDIGTGNNQGSAYVFVKPPGGWSGTINESAKLTASDAGEGDLFGLRVAIDGDVIVVTARGDDAPLFQEGTAYVFVKPAGGWSGNLTQNIKLAASDANQDDQFGSAVAVRGDTIVIGAILQEEVQNFPPGASAGAAYLFQKPAAGWTGGGVLHQNAKLKASDANGQNFFGGVVGLVGDTVVVGAVQSSGVGGGGPAGPGAVYVFERPPAGWSGIVTETARLTAAGGVNGHRFGVALGIDSDTILVGADSAPAGANPNRGAVYQFEKPAGGWSGQLTAGQALTASDGAAGDLFGQQLELDGGDTLFVGAPFDDVGTDSNQGSVYVFVTDQVPTLTLPGNITAEATSAAGAVVMFSAQANDPEQGPLTPICVPASGATFPLGATQVDCSVTDSAGGQITGSFTVTVVDTTAPALTVPGDVTAEATRPDGAVVTFSARASDLVDGAIGPVCTPPSGAAFAIGATLVTCTATDVRGNAASGTFTINVGDTTPPSLLVPPIEIAEATGPAGAVVAFTVIAVDAVGGAIVPVCLPASGAQFPVGQTHVTCTATDARGNAATGEFPVLVDDTIAPIVTVPADITAEAAGPGGAFVVYTATATDLVDGAIAPHCEPGLGDAFARGETRVICTATDAHGNEAEARFSVRVVDTTPPALALPGNITVAATSDAGAVVSYAATASDLVYGVVAVVCTPASGSTFPVGTTTGSCFATDGEGNATSGTFTVTVQETPGPDPDTIAFGLFNVLAQIDLRPGAADDRFAVEALFRLGAGNDGLDAVTEDVVLTLGGASWTIPAGSFRRTRFGAFVSDSVVGGTRLSVSIHALGAGRFLLLAAGSGAALDGTTNPVTVSLAIGDDAGAAAVIAAIR